MRFGINMRIKEVTFGVERKVSDGDFGSLGYNIQMVASLEEDDDEDDCYEDLKKQVESKASFMNKKLKHAQENFKTKRK